MAICHHIFFSSLYIFTTHRRVSLVQEYEVELSIPNYEIIVQYRNTINSPALIRQFWSNPSLDNQRCPLIITRRDYDRSPSRLLLLLAPQTQRLGYRPKPQSTQQFVDAQAAQQPVDKPAETQTVEQLSDQPEHTGEEEPNRRDDLEERLREEAPQRTELLLRVRHVGALLLAVVDGLHDGGGEFLEQLREVVLLGRGFSRGGVGFGAGGDAAVGVEAADGAVALLEYAAAFF